MQLIGLVTGAILGEAASALAAGDRPGDQRAPGRSSCQPGPVIGLVIRGPLAQQLPALGAADRPGDRGDPGRSRRPGLLIILVTGAILGTAAGLGR